MDNNIEFLKCYFYILGMREKKIELDLAKSFPLNIKNKFSLIQ